MNAYPVDFSVEYPDRDLNRLTSAFRIFAVIPILIVLAAIGGYSNHYDAGADSATVVIGGTGLLFLPPLLMIVFRQKYPRWWFDWNLELLRFTNRVGTYVALMSDRYPSTDENQYVELGFPYPDAPRPQPLAAAGQVAARDPALHRALLPLHRRRLRGDRRLVRDPVHRPLPERASSTTSRACFAGTTAWWLRVRARHRRVPAVPAEAVTAGS